MDTAGEPAQCSTCGVQVKLVSWQIAGTYVPEMTSSARLHSLE